MNKNAIYSLIALAVISLVLLVPALKGNDAKQLRVVENVSVLQCATLAEGCTTMIDGMQVLLKFPKDIIYLTSFPIEVRFLSEHASNVESVKLDFQMLEMNMGMNLYQLQKDSRNHSLWKGKAVLPVCVSGRSDWQVHLEAKTKDTIYKTIFQFEVKRSTQ